MISPYFLPLFLGRQKVHTSQHPLPLTRAMDKSDASPCRSPHSSFLYSSGSFQLLLPFTHHGGEKPGLPHQSSAQLTVQLPLAVSTLGQYLVGQPEFHLSKDQCKLPPVACCDVVFLHYVRVFCEKVVACNSFWWETDVFPLH